jgi:hypothetical protein
MMRQSNGTKRLRGSTLLVGLILVLGAGCGDQEAKVVNSNTDDPDQSTQEPPENWADAYIANQTNVIMPWTHRIADDVVDMAQVEAGRLVFADGPAADAVADVERGDVIVSANPASPFLRKIQSIERLDGELIFHTRNAEITEAVYKGELTQQQPSETGSQGLRRQELNAEEAQRISADEVTIGVPDSDISGLPNVAMSNGKVTYTHSDGTKMSASPSLKINASVYFDLKVEPGGGMDTSHTDFVGTKTCQTADDCFPTAARGENRGVSCQSGQCAFHSTEYDGFWFDGAGPSCNDLIGALDYAAQNDACGADFDRYYEGTMNLSQVENGVCDGRLPPHPVQTDWAKENCTGALKRMVVDADGSLTPSTGPLTMTFAGASAEKSWTLWQSQEKRMMSRLFFIGWFPVYITANGSAKLEASVEASVSASASLEPVELTGLAYGAGFHYYASASDDDNLGVRMNDGTIKAFADYEQNNGGWGDFHLNPERTPDPQWTGLQFEQQDLTLKASGSVTAELEFAPRVDLLLYDVAGPYLEPFSPYASIEFSAGGVFSTQNGASGAGACSDEIASLCGRLGVKGTIGVTAENICGSECNWSTTLYDTCSDYCPANEEALCYKTCLGMEPEVPAPVEVIVSWQSDAVDLDLKMLQPEDVDYQNTATNPDGFQHGGDSCPPTFAGCNDVADGSGNFTERIFVKNESTPPASGSNLVLQVYNYQSNGQGTFDLTVQKDGEVIREWTGQSTGQEGDRPEFSFTLP